MTLRGEAEYAYADGAGMSCPDGPGLWQMYWRGLGFAWTVVAAAKRGVML